MNLKLRRVEQKLRYLHASRVYSIGGRSRHEYPSKYFSSVSRWEIDRRRPRARLDAVAKIRVAIFVPTTRLTYGRVTKGIGNFFSQRVIVAPAAHDRSEARISLFTQRWKVRARAVVTKSITKFRWIVTCLKQERSQRICMWARRVLIETVWQMFSFVRRCVPRPLHAVSWSNKILFSDIYIFEMFNSPSIISASVTIARR